MTSKLLLGFVYPFTVLLAIVALLIQGQEAIAGYAAATKVYYVEATDPDTIRVVNVDGTGDTEVYNIDTNDTGSTSPQRIAVDSKNDYVYWTDQHQDNIRRVHIDGTNGSVVHDPGGGVHNLYGIVLDVDKEQIYFAHNTNPGPGDIRRINYDDTGATSLVVGTAGRFLANDFAVDLVNSKIYYGDKTSNTMRRVNIDGTGDEVFLTAITNITRIEVDPAGGYIYYAPSHDQERIFRVDLSGSGTPAVIEDQDTGFNNRTVLGMGLDTTSEIIYFYKKSGPAFRRINSDGTDETALGSLSGVVQDVDDYQPFTPAGTVMWLK